MSHDLGYRNISDFMKNNLEMIYESFFKKIISHFVFIYSYKK
jgi:hypothetical protein